MNNYTFKPASVRDEPVLTSCRVTERDIPAALEQLQANVADLEKAVEALAGRLQTVIKPEPCGKDDYAPPPEPVRSPVANGICAAANNIHSSVLRLRQLESLVQL